MNQINRAAVQQSHISSATPPQQGGDLFSVPQYTRAQKLISAAEELLDVLCKGEALRASVLRSSMVSAFGGSDTEGLWQWRDVYEAQEIASFMFVRKYQDALMRLKPAQTLKTLDKLQSFLTTQTRRSDTSQRWQQFSTPLPFGFVLAQAANLQAEDTVLEPSAGTGLLAVFAQNKVANLHLNELEVKRHSLLGHLFEDCSITSHNGEYLNDLLDDSVKPSVIMMNPPFSSSPTMNTPDPAVAGRHIFSALNRLKDGGRLVTITGRNFAPVNARWRDAFIRLQGMARVSFSAPLSGSVYAKHGTTVETRLTVFDKCPADVPKDFSAYHSERLESLEDLLELIQQKVPARLEIKDTSITPLQTKSRQTEQKKAEPKPVSEPIDVTKGAPLDYQTLDWAAPDEELRDCLYEPYVPQSVLIQNAKEHPTPLVQSAAMASVAPPKPNYQPDLPERLITEGIPSDAQLESIIYAGQAHERILPGEWTINQHYDLAGEGEIEGKAVLKTVQFRQGWFLGDGTGCGKGRQVAGIILDNRLKGRKQAIWISKNDKLLEDARRDWAALGGDPKQIVPLSKFKQGQPIQLQDGNPVMNKAVLAKRDAMIEHLASLPAVPSALDQILHHFGIEVVSEVTGRTIRLVREDGVLKVQKRPASSNLDETQAYMDDKKRILVFSDAGGTGRSYHADRDAKNSRRRVHYLLEPGWRADNAIQGLGRSNRTNQASAPLFRPVATNVKGEKRFLSTIARRLDSLGAITKGQRQTGGQGMFRSEDNLESTYARSALRQLYRQIIHGKLQQCSLQEFEEQTGLSLVDRDGTMREEMPPMSRFLNRVLALTINRQNALFEAFGSVLEQIIEGARASGMLDEGVETLQAESFSIMDIKEVYTHDETDAKTQCLTITRKDKLRPTSLKEVMSWFTGEAKLLVNARSGRAAMQVPALSRMSEGGAVQPCVRLYRPQECVTMTEVELITSKWEAVAPNRFKEAWESELATLPEYKSSTFYLVTGLLLPIWDRMTKDNLRIYRLQSDDDQRLLGRVLQEKDLSKFYNALGLDAPKLSLEAIKSSVLEDGTSYPLAQGLRLRRTRIMGEYRIELEYAFGPDVFDRLSKFGCFTEIIQYKKRAFIPVNAQCEDILKRVLEHYPMTGDRV